VAYLVTDLTLVTLLLRAGRAREVATVSPDPVEVSP
jgi:hypothetical protein